MDRSTVSIRYDKDLDFLEVLFEKKEGYFDPIGDSGLMVRYDDDGNVIGFAIEGATEVGGNAIDVELSARR